MVNKNKCMKISGRYYNLDDIEIIFRTRIDCIIPTDLTEEELEETTNARVKVKNKK